MMKGEIDMTAFQAIESERTSSVPFSPSGDDYLHLFERVERYVISEAHARARQLASSQDVKPIRISEFKGEFWPHDESADDFLEWLETIRKEDVHRSVPE